MPYFSQTEGFILVGGKSSRMGRDKALLEIAGKPLLLRTAGLLSPMVASITLVTAGDASTSAANLGEPSPHARFGFPLIGDRWPGAGPLGGIATSLAAARQPWSIILACDLPYLTGDWLAWLLGRAANSQVDEPADIFIPESARGLEPLCAVYRSACAPVLAAALERGVRKVTDAIAKLNLERIAEKDWRRFSPDGKLFHNMNTPWDYQEARSHFEK